MMNEILIGCAAKDRQTAELLAERLRKEGMPPEVIQTDGEDYSEEIFSRARIYIFLFSGETNESVPMQESLRAAAASDTIIMPLRLTDELPSAALHYYLGSIHWLDGRGEKFGNALDLLCERCRAVLTAAPEKPGKKKRLIAVLCAAVILAGTAAAFLFRNTSRHVRAGDIVTFGRYEQDGNEANGTEAIEWIVLEADSEQGTWLLLSRSCLNSAPYNEEQAEVTWETCSLREWLNGTFTDTAFTEEDRRRIVQTEVDNDTVRQGSLDHLWGQYGAKGGNATEDSVWLLSLNETEFYLPETSDRAAAFTGNMQKTGLPAECDWWLRSPGKENNAAMIVKANGSRTEAPVNQEGTGVRPVIRIRGK